MCHRMSHIVVLTKGEPSGILNGFVASMLLLGSFLAPLLLLTSRSVFLAGLAFSFRLGGGLGRAFLHVGDFLDWHLVW
jgi:hypothetical protein